MNFRDKCQVGLLSLIEQLAHESERGGVTGEALAPLADGDAGGGVLKVGVEDVEALCAAIQAGLPVIEREGDVAVPARKENIREAREHTIKGKNVTRLGYFCRCSVGFIESWHLTISFSLQKIAKRVVGETGLEPVTPGLEGRCSKDFQPVH